MTPAKKTSFADDETVDSSVVEDSQEFDADLTAALNRQPNFHPQDETLAVHGTSREEQVARELGTFSDREDETENETDRLLVEKTKLKWKYCNKVLFLKQVIAMEMWRPDNRTNSNWDLLCDALQVKGPPGEFAALNRKKAWDYLTLIAKEYRSNRYKRFAPSLLSAALKMWAIPGRCPLPSPKNASIGEGNGRWTMGNGFRRPSPIAHCPKMQTL